MLVLTNLILCTTTTPHNDTSNQNNANGTHNISYNTSSKSSFTFDNKTLDIHEIIGDTKKEIENHTLITRELMQNDPELHKKPKDKQLLFGVKRRGEISIGGSITPDEKWKSDEDDVLDFNKQREIDDAADLGLSNMKELIEVKEPMWYGLGLVLDQNDPATHVANFGRPNRKALALSQFGYAALEASSQISKSFPENVRNEGFRKAFQSRLLQEDCPLRGTPRCSSSSKFFRTADGTCNNLAKPWWGASMLPMERFLRPKYEDDIQEVRRARSGRRLPSARDVSVRIHRDKNQEIPTVTLMFMQWGQFIDHDLVSTVKSRSFNGSIPRCCDRRGQNPLPLDLMHPSCLPIHVSDDDWFLSRFGIRCLEFMRSAPATRLDCDLGWREQMNQVTSYLDASNVYGSDLETSDALRTFRNGKIQYGRPLGNGPLNPPDPPGGELCRSGALSTECFQGGDGRFGEQSGLTALHTVWVRYHNKVATTLGKLNKHWGDERIFQETRKIVGALVQHITYREFLPIVVGPEVMDLFELSLSRKGYFKGYDERVNPAIANSFGAAAFRFGHSMVQNSYVRFDGMHRPLFNNVSLHRELDNFENIWNFGSVDRLLLGFVNQPAQRRDEFICEELTNNLFRPLGAPFGVDLAAINIQRGRDHGLPPYTSWRKPCGLSEIKNWGDLQTVLTVEAAQRLRSLYEHVDDIDLFTAGLAEKPVRGGIVGPTFACIIAQQFFNLRKGDRFWYENPGFHSSFTPAQLSQIKRVTLSEILCQTMGEFETVQPFVFLSADNLRNIRLSCDGPLLNKFDLAPWTEDIELQNDDIIDNNNEHFDDNDLQNRDIKDFFDFGDFRSRRDVWEARKRKRVTTQKPNAPKRRYTTTDRTDLKIPITNVTVHTVPFEKHYGYYDETPAPQFQQYQRYTTRKYYPIRDKNDYTYLFAKVSSTTPIPRTTPSRRSQTPLEVNIKIQYYPPTSSPPKRKQPIVYARPQNSNGYGNGYSNKPQTNYRPQQSYNDELYLVQKPYRRPNTNQGYSFSGETFVLKPMPMQNEPVAIDDSEHDQNYDLLDEQEDFLPTKPLVNVKLTDDQTYNSDKHHTLEYNDKQHAWQVYQNYDDAEPEIDRVFNTKQTDREQVSNKRKFTEEKPPGHPYSIAYIEKLSSHNKNDKLDFRTRLVYKRKFNKPTTDDDEGYVSSAKSDDETEEYDDDYDRQEKASYREGSTFIDDARVDKMEYERIRLVDIDVLLNKEGHIRWKPYNKSETQMADDLKMPELDQNVRSSDEIPKRINSVNYNE